MLFNIFLIFGIRLFNVATSASSNPGITKIAINATKKKKKKDFFRIFFKYIYKHVGMTKKNIWVKEQTLQYWEASQIPKGKTL